MTFDVIKLFFKIFFLGALNGRQKTLPGLASQRLRFPYLLPLPAAPASWTKFLLLLPKLLYSRRNNHSNDCANIEMGNNWREVLFKTKVEIIKNKLTSIRSLKFKKMHEADTKKGKYITQSRFRGFCDLSLEWTNILPIIVKLVLFHVNVFYNLITWPATDQSSQTTEWLELEISLII